MNTALWVVQIALAVLYFTAGLWKVTGQGPALEKVMPGLSLGLIRLVGLGEALAGLGLVLPAVPRSRAAVAGWAGAILAAEAAVFVVYHLRHRAYLPFAATLVLGLLAAFVAYGRLKRKSSELCPTPLSIMPDKSLREGAVRLGPALSSTRRHGTGRTATGR